VEEAPTIAEPSRRLSPQARWIWRANWAAGCVVALVVARMLASELPDGWDPILWVVPLAALVAGTPLLPELRWRRWRWEVREREIDLRRGVLRERRTLIPMMRVQHVETTRGVLEQALGLATVAIHTAAGSHTIPLLRDRDAGALRARIAELARTDEDEPPDEATAAPPAPEGTAGPRAPDEATAGPRTPAEEPPAG
jgi:membrane protein YdbS with pleckstrin-like domain